MTLLRPLRPSDEGAVERMLLGTIDVLYPAGQSWLRRTFTELSEGSASALVLVLQDKVVAIAIHKPKRNSTKLCTFFVSPMHRGVGLGSRLMEALNAQLAESMTQESYVTVAHHLDGVVRFFIAHGYTPAALERDRYGSGRHEVVLTRAHVDAGRR